MEVPTEKVRRIYSSILKQAPPGEFNAVFDDIRNLHDDPELLDEQTDTTLVEYNNDNFLPIFSDELPKPTLLTKFNHVDYDESIYYDPNSNKEFTYDAIQRIIIDTQECKKVFDPELLTWRGIIQKELDLYIEAHYAKNGVGVAFIYKGNIVACISSHKYMRRNCYAGRWISNWEIPVFQPSAQVLLTGRGNVLTHYYEDGNVQMNSTKNFKQNVTYGSDIYAAAKETLKSITEAESAFSDGMFEKFDNSEKTFKMLRRALPVTRTKMDWLKAINFRVVKDLPSTSPQ